MCGGAQSLNQENVTVPEVAGRERPSAENVSLLVGGCMTVNLIALSRCAAISGLRAHEMIVGATPSVKHSPLLAAYRLKLAKGRDAVRGMIVADIRDSVELGEIDFAADLLVVLRQFLTMCETADARASWKAPGGRGTSGDFDPPSKS